MCTSAPKVPPAPPPPAPAATPKIQDPVAELQRTQLANGKRRAGSGLESLRIERTDSPTSGLNLPD